MELFYSDTGNSKSSDKVANKMLNFNRVMIEMDQ